MRKPKTSSILFILAGVTLLFFVANLSMGSVSIPLSTLINSFFSDTGTAATILWKFRMPKAITCILAGAALSTGGLLMQTLFRNPMAGPDVLGLTSGSSLFVALLIMAGQFGGGPGNLILNPWSIALAASTGGALVFIAIMAVSRVIKDNTALLIVGLMISAATSSVVSVLQFTSQANDLQAFMIWTLGSVGSTSWRELGVLFIIVAVGLSMSFSLIKSLNGLLLGENYAVSLKVNVKKTRLWVVITTGLMVGAVTAFCGPIAFVGLAVPHLVRLILPVTNHKILIPAVMLGGALLLLMCDVLAQLPGSTRVLPLNAITSLIGAPVVIWMVIKAKRINV